MLTNKMKAAMALATENGCVFSGTDVIAGRVVRVSAGTLRALERLGLVSIEIAPDDGIVATPVQFTPRAAK
jgi:hypothetical protein